MAERDPEWTLEAIFQLGGGVQVAIASTVPLRARDWRYLGHMLDVTLETANDRLRIEREAAERLAAKTHAAGVAGDECGPGNECGRTGCPECQQ